jgi:hypothetical protein
VKIDVWVDGHRWRQVTSLAELGPEDDAFVIELENGRIRFGDGVNGRRPPTGAEIVVAYQHGAGGSGDVGTDAPPIRTSNSDAVDTTDQALWTVIRTQTSSISIPAHGRVKTQPGDRCSHGARFRLRLALAFAAGVITARALPRLRRE